MTNPNEAPERIYARVANMNWPELPLGDILVCSESPNELTGDIEYLRLDIHEREVRERNDAIKDLLDLLDYDHPEYHNDYHEKLDRARALIGGE